ncbi:MAG: ornithine cyclodeaminase family protein [Actinomycetota bacterium]
MLVLTRAEVEELLDIDRLVDALSGAMADLSAGIASIPNRISAEVADHDGFLAAMPAFVPSSEALAAKLVSLFPHNRDRPTHQAMIACFDPSDGTPIAVMDGEFVTAARTAAGSALATRLLARADATVLAVLGTGVQARSHARAIPRVRPIDTLRIAGRSAEKAERLALDLAAQLDLKVEPADDYASALDGADIVCATTHSPDPVVRREWLAHGVHINSVGYNTEGREVDADTVADALVVVESRASALAPPPSGTNDLLWPIRDGLITADHVHAEIGELVGGSKPGRTSADQITLYKSVGVAAQDAAAASLVLEAARRRGVGTEIPN